MHTHGRWWDAVNDWHGSKPTKKSHTNADAIKALTNDIFASKPPFKRYLRAIILQKTINAVLLNYKK